RLPRLVRWVGEFGAQAVPTTDDFLEPARWPDLDWEGLEHTHSLQKRRFDEHVPPAEHPTFASWQAATQAYQATVVKHHVETLRRLKYRPTGGFAHFLLADGHPAITWSVLDHERVPKAAYGVLRDACRPVIVVADRLPATVAPGDPFALDVHVVSDLRTPLDGVTVRAELTWTGGSHRWSWQGDVGADECLRVGTLQFVIPDVSGPLELRLTLDAGDHSATNHYEAVIVSGT
ncbi:MAG: hypothetical protein JO291_14815, partial [Acidimicrobiia bacterium]|nr:hypothetical protein [Acidimicrobiia bacterium]